MEDKTVEEVAAPAKKQFEGFRKPEKPNKNFYHVPNEWTDIMAGIDNLSELKVIEYIMRHTWGFKEYGTLKLFTTEEFVNGRKRKDGTRMDKGTGLGTTAAKQGIAKAIEHGYVICETDESDKGRIKKYYGLKMLPTHDLDSHNVTMPSHNVTTDGHNPTPDSRDETTHSRNATSWVSLDDHRSEKETPEINLEKNTIERKNGASQQNATVSTQDESSHSFAHSSLNFSSSLSSTQENQETKQTKPEVELSSEEQRIHGYWQELGFEAKITANLKEHWGKLVDCIQNSEQFKSLYEHTKQQIENNPGITNKRVNPGNLVNTNNLNGWKQAQEKKNKVTAENKHLQPVNKNVRTGHAEMIINYNKKAIARGWLIAKDEGFLGDTATDSDIANVINKWSRLYKDTEHAEEHLKSAKKIQCHCAFDNNSFFAMLHDVKDDTDNSGDKSMSMFLAILAKKLGCNQTLSTSNQKPAEKDAMPQKRPTRPNNRVPLSDDALRNRIGRLCKGWGDDNLEMHFQEAKRLQQEFGLNNDELSSFISKVIPETARYSNPTMQDLFKNLRSALFSKAAVCAG